MTLTPSQVCESEGRGAPVKLWVVMIAAVDRLVHDPLSGKATGPANDRGNTDAAFKSVLFLTGERAVIAVLGAELVAAVPRSIVTGKNNHRVVPQINFLDCRKNTPSPRSMASIMA